MPYVLCWDHEIGDFTWGEFRLPVIDPCEPIEVLSRRASFDFVLPTERFFEILPRLEPAIKAVQLGCLPPPYLDMRRIRGKQLYRILGECGWHVLLETPAKDFGQVLSPRLEVLERAVRLMPTSDE
jgi:hypothetical protein